MLSRQFYGDSLIDRYNNDNPIENSCSSMGINKLFANVLYRQTVSGHRVRVYKDTVACSMSGSDEGVGLYNPKRVVECDVF